MKWGVPKIHIMAVIGSKAGIQQLIDKHPDVQITVGTVDDVDTESGLLQPGLGDSGDRLFGTAPAADDDESLLHPSRRKRALSSNELAEAL
jgi:Uracil phosphoribosyltransferase